MSPWQVWERKGVPRTRSRSPAVSWPKTGRMMLNKAATEALGDPEDVLLLYDPETGRVGIRPTAGDDERRVKVSSNGRTSRAIAARVFRRDFGLPESVLGRRYEPWVEDGMLVFDLPGAETEE